MVVPGIQALFGFQLVAEFNQRFDVVLSVGASRGAGPGWSGDRLDSPQCALC